MYPGREEKKLRKAAGRIRDKPKTLFSKSIVS